MYENTKEVKKEPAATRTCEAIIRSFPGRVLTVTVLCDRKRPMSFDSCAPASAKRSHLNPNTATVNLTRSPTPPVRLLSITTSRAAHTPVDNHVLPCLSGMHLSGWYAKLRAMSLIVEKKSSSVTA